MSLISPFDKKKRAAKEFMEAQGLGAVLKFECPPPSPSPAATVSSATGGPAPSAPGSLAAAPLYPTSNPPTSLPPLSPVTSSPPVPIQTPSTIVTASLSISASLPPSTSAPAAGTVTANAAVLAGAPAAPTATVTTPTLAPAAQAVVPPPSPSPVPSSPSPSPPVGPVPVPQHMAQSPRVIPLASPVVSGFSGTFPNGNVAGLSLLPSLPSSASPPLLAEPSNGVASAAVVASEPVVHCSTGLKLSSSSLSSSSAPDHGLRITVPPSAISASMITSAPSPTPSGQELNSKRRRVEDNESNAPTRFIREYKNRALLKHVRFLRSEIRKMEQQVSDLVRNESASRSRAEFFASMFTFFEEDYYVLKKIIDAVAPESEKSESDSSTIPWLMKRLFEGEDLFFSSFDAEEMKVKLTELRQTLLLFSRTVERIIRDPSGASRDSGGRSSSSGVSDAIVTLLKERESQVREAEAALMKEKHTVSVCVRERDDLQLEINTLRTELARAHRRILRVEEYARTLSHGGDVNGFTDVNMLSASSNPLARSSSLPAPSASQPIQSASGSNPGFVLDPGQLDAAVRAREEQIAEREFQLNKRLEEHKLLQARMQECSDENNNLKADLEGLRSRLNLLGGTSDRTTSLEARCHQADTEVLRLRSLLQNEQERFRRENDEVKERCKSAVEKLQEEMTTIAENLVRMDSVVKAREEEIDGLKRTVESAQTLLKSCQEYSDASKSRFESLTSRLNASEHSSELGSSVRELQDLLKDKDSDASSKLSGFADQIDGLSSDLDYHKQLCGVFESEMETLTTSYDDMKAKNVKLVDRLKEKDDTLKRVMSDRSREAQGRDVLRAENNKLMERLREKEEQFRTEKRQIQFQTERLESLEALLSSKEKEFQTVAAQVAALQKVEGEILSLKRSHDQLASRLADREKELTSEKSAREEVARRAKEGEESAAYFKQRLSRYTTVTEGSGSTDKERSSSDRDVQKQLRASQEEVLGYKEMLFCGVCRTNMKSCIISRCFHQFCRECIGEAVATRNRKCPTCKVMFDKKDIHDVFF